VVGATQDLHSSDEVVPVITMGSTEPIETTRPALRPSDFVSSLLVAPGANSVMLDINLLPLEMVDIEISVQSDDPTVRECRFEWRDAGGAAYWVHQMWVGISLPTVHYRFCLNPIEVNTRLLCQTTDAFTALSRLSSLGSRHVHVR